MLLVLDKSQKNRLKNQFLKELFRKRISISCPKTFLKTSSHMIEFLSFQERYLTACSRLRKNLQKTTIREDF